MKIFTDQQFNEIEKIEKLGQEIANLFNLERVKGTKRPEFKTSYGNKTYLGLGRTILNLTEENIN